MKHIISFFLAGFLIWFTELHAQTMTVSANLPSGITGPQIPTGRSVYGVFAGRTPCQEFLKEFNMDEREQCTKRKMGLILYHDSVTQAPTQYETWGMGQWSGKGSWQILRGMAADPNATVFQLDLGQDTFLFLLKGDDNVLFILDRNKNFLPGNAKHSYTFNRVK